MSHKILSKNLPDFLLSSIKRNQKKFTKREISCDIKDSVQVGGSMHAPEYDNFDYSYYMVVDLKSRSVSFPQDGLQPNDSKSVRLENDQFLVYGDKMSGYASITCNSATHDKHFGDLKTVNQMLKGASKDRLVASLQDMGARLQKIASKK